ncbi:hypothetical protein PIB30_011278 [Stylosanthes scabra]|uniref:Uncharacterized protein n=1 Tax=Stylosanthes scabra TaxID=79078 RepID=A0ABU6V7J6_9FABA|nr:hypothetical protein [Stylosanthes scabra]
MSYVRIEQEGSTIGRTPTLYVGVTRYMWGAKACNEAIADIESRDECTNVLSQNNSLAQVLEKEHSGIVRGVGPGLCLTKLVGSSSQQSSYGVQIEEYQKQIVELRAEAAEEKKKTLAMQNVMRFLIERLGMTCHLKLLHR